MFYDIINIDYEIGIFHIQNIGNRLPLYRKILGGMMADKSPI